MADDALPEPGRWAHIACVAEVTAFKAGNVHPTAAFEEVTWETFVVSAMACAPVLNCAVERGVGPTVLECVEATRAAVGTNTNLGIILLLAPLCAVPLDRSLGEGVGRVLAALDDDDARSIYRAIRLADPGGLGRHEVADVRDNPDRSVVEAMRRAADRDAVARQYVNGFADVLDRIAPLMSPGRGTLDQAIVWAHLEQMAHEPDSLIRRKCGEAIACESQQRAVSVLAAGWPETPDGYVRFDEFDAWSRADGHRRNPGTSADLITAGLFAALREGVIASPFMWSRTLSPSVKSRYDG